LDRKKKAIRSKNGSDSRGVFLTLERFRVNMAHAKQSRPDSGRGFQVTVLKKGLRLEVDSEDRVWDESTAAHDIDFV